MFQGFELKTYLFLLDVIYLTLIWKISDPSSSALHSLTIVHFLSPLESSSHVNQSINLYILNGWYSLKRDEGKKTAKVER